ncbi:MAG: histidine phosphatase family protein [Gemmatimonadetes bacterium]|nr:histidine phosphatase family protein [Gemmatimonadota bacterium]
MTTLVLLRHGIAIDRDDPACPDDPERALTAQGRKRTESAMRGLARLDVRPDAIYTSPYVRAVQTAEIARDVLAPRLDPVRVPELLPEADPTSLLARVHEAGPGTFLLTGHNPHLSLVLARLVGSREPFAWLKKSGVAVIEWHPERLCGDLQCLATPRMLRALGDES